MDGTVFIVYHKRRGVTDNSVYDVVDVCSTMDKAKTLAKMLFEDRMKALNRELNNAEFDPCSDTREDMFNWSCMMTREIKRCEDSIKEIENSDARHTLSINGILISQAWIDSFEEEGDDGTDEDEYEEEE